MPNPPVTGSGPIWLQNAEPRLFAVDSIAAPTELYIYAKTVGSDQLMLDALTNLQVHCAAGGALNGVDADLATMVAPAADTTTTSLLKGYKRIVVDLI
jgi:hypothetical protein